MSTTLPLYWNLSSADKAERLGASVKLVSTCLDFQAQFAPPEENPAADSDFSEEEEVPGGKKEPNVLDELNAEDVRYALRRLIRGLASPRESSRLGFAVALTELLSRLTTISASQTISLVLSSSQTAGSMQGHEIRDAYFARLFGLVSIIQSGLILRDSPLPTSGSSKTRAATLEDFKTVTNELMSLGEKKSWLKESCWWALGLLLDALVSEKSANVSWKEEAIRWLAQTIYAENIPWGPEKIAFTVSFQRAVPSSLPWKTLLAPTFKDELILSSRNIPTVARLMRDAPIEETPASTEGPSSKSSTTSWKPQLHYAYSTILSSYFPSSSSPSSSAPPAHQSTFQEFWRAVIDESLFSNTSSAERKSHGFSVFQLALTTIPPELAQDTIPLLFTQNFMRTWINQLSGKERVLHKAARGVANALLTLATSHPTVGFTLVLQLIGRHGSRQFDQITRTKTVETLLSKVDLEGVKEYVKFLEGQFSAGGGAGGAELESQREWALVQLAALVRNTAIPREDAWICEILDLFVVHGFGKAGSAKGGSSKKQTNKDKLPITDSIRTTCRQKLYGALADLSSQTVIVKHDEKASRKQGVLSSGELWLTYARRKIQSVVLSSPSALEGSGAEALLSRLSESDAPGAMGGRILLESLIVRAYDADANEGVEKTVQTATAAISRLFPAKPSKPKSKKRKSTDAGMDVDEPEDIPAIDELVDVLVGFLESSTAFSRTMAGFAFGFWTGIVKPSTLEFILKQLDEKNLEAGDDDSSEDEEHDHDHGSDEEMVDGEDAAVDSDEDVDEDSDASSDDDEEEEFDIEADDELRHKIAAALNMKTSDDEGGSESEDEVVDDDEMLKMDEQLAAVFKMQQGPKGDKQRAKGERREATHFKNRVLDLLDLFVKNEPFNPLTPTLLMPLIDIMRSARPDEVQFTEKCAGLIGRISNLKQVPELDADAQESLMKQFGELHELARKAPSASFESTLSSASLYLSKVLAHSGEAQATQGAEAYRVSLRDFVTRKGSKLNLSFFQTWVKRQMNVAWGLRDELPALCTSEDSVNDFRQMQVVQLLQDFVSQLPALGESVPKPQVVTFLRNAQEALYTLLTRSASSSDSDGLNANQVKSIFRCALQTVRQAKRVAPTPEELATIWSAKKVQDLIEMFEANERWKKPSAVLSMCKELLAMVSPGDKTKKGKKKGDQPKGSTAVASSEVEAGPTPAIGNGDLSEKAKKKSSKRKVDGLQSNEAGPETVTPKKKKKTKTA